MRSKRVVSDCLRGFIHPRWWSPDFWTINSIKLHRNSKRGTMASKPDSSIASHSWNTNHNNQTKSKHPNPNQPCSPLKNAQLGIQQQIIQRRSLYASTPFFPDLPYPIRFFLFLGRFQGGEGLDLGSLGSTDRVGLYPFWRGWGKNGDVAGRKVRRGFSGGTVGSEKSSNPTQSNGAEIQGGCCIFSFF